MSSFSNDNQNLPIFDLIGKRKERKSILSENRTPVKNAIKSFYSALYRRYTFGQIPFYWLSKLLQPSSRKIPINQLTMYVCNMSLHM
jgi:hypothetical protein